MRYLLEADVIIRSLSGDPTTVQLLVTLARQAGAPLCVSAVTRMEVWEGVYRAVDPAQVEQAYERFFAALTVLPFDGDVAKRGAQLRHDLRQQSRRTRERAIDLQIAATALHHGLALVTYNTHDFADIPGLNLYRR